jgi:UDP-N-acetyl-D-mannosaminuronic acid dehydrogenase
MPEDHGVIDTTIARPIAPSGIGHIFDVPSKRHRIPLRVHNRSDAEDRFIVSISPFRSMSRNVVSVVELGYVGLPLACSLAREGLMVNGMDLDRNRVDAINRGMSPLRGEEPGLPELLSEVVSNDMMAATDDPSILREAEAIFVCVNTPMDESKRPMLGSLEGAIRDIGRNLSGDPLVSVESTIPPGTMDGLVLPVLEEESGLCGGRDFSLVHCPERVMPGRLLLNMSTYQRVLGGLDVRSLERGRSYYSRLVEAEIHETDLISAEISKTVENAYRDVQIAFANEVAMACERLGANVFEIRRLVNTSPFRDMHYPGSGVGGHCIPKDPWLLVSSVQGENMDLIPTARSVNDGMPMHLANMAMETIRESGIEGTPRISIMGLGFLKDSGDVRNSPTIQVVKALHDRADLIIHDPFVDEWGGVPLTGDIEEALSGSDCAVFVTDHSAYQTLMLPHMASLMRNRIIVDGRNLFDGDKCQRAGFIYSGVGKGRRPGP